MTASAVRALMGGLIDYAGLFPPAALSMGEAVANYADYRSSADAWALGRFVLPAARLEEFAASAEPLLGGAPWRLSVLAQPTDEAAIRAFNNTCIGRAVIDTVEAKGSTVEEVGALAPLADVATVFVEVPVRGDPDELVGAIAAGGLRAKVRTGGVTTDAFPSAAEVARFLEACTRHGVLFKATAGLHHPLRGDYALTYEPGAARGEMFGFLNVFLAAMLSQRGAPTLDVEALLLEHDATAIRFTSTSVTWRHHTFDRDSIAGERAQFAASFGSCSFREPIDDLSALGLL